MVEGSRFFASHNHQALRDARLKLYLEDAKTFLKITPQRYDIVISEPSNPWIAGIGNLFSVEFYQDVKKRLQPNGLVVQWFHAYEMTDETLKLVLRTFAASFEHVTLWSATATDLLLIGSKAPFYLDFEKSLSRFEDPKIREELARLKVMSFPTILSLPVASDEGVRKAAGKGRVNEDLFPILEYEAPKAFFLGRESRFLVPYDERHLPRNGSPLFLAQYLETQGFSVEQIKDMTTYHFTNGSLTRLNLARSFAELWLQKAPIDLEAHWALAQIERGRGNIEVARRELQYLLNLKPNKREYLEAAAHLEFQAYLSQRSFVNSRTAEKALTYLHRLLDLKGGNKSRIYKDLAQIHAADRDYISAMSFLEKAAAYAQKDKGDLQPDSLWLEAADMALELDDLNMANVYVRKALAHNPGNLVAEIKLQQLLRQKEMEQK